MDTLRHRRATDARDVIFLDAPVLKIHGNVKVNLCDYVIPLETKENNATSQLKFGTTRDDTSSQNGEQEFSEEEEEHESLSEKDSSSRDEEYKPQAPFMVPVGVELVALIAEADEPANYNDAVEAKDIQHWLSAMKE